MEKNKNNKTKYFDLTIPQENIWLVEQLNPNTNINNIYGTFFINKKLDLDILKQAINKIIENNDALRIRITEINSKPVQYISDYEFDDLPIYYLDSDDQNKINSIIDSINLEHMNLINNKLYDLRLISTPTSVYVCIKMHHIIADAWSMGQIFIKNINKYYQMIEENRIIDKEESYLKYCEKIEKYKKSDKYLRDQQFWKKYVKNISYENQFEIVKNKHNNRIVKNIDNHTNEKIKDFCEKNNISEYAFLLAIISIYFSKIFNNQNIVIGTPFLNRQKSKKELEIMGMFVATLPISIDVDLEDNFINLCKKISTNNMSCFKHSSFPYSEIQKEYIASSGNNTNLYEIAFSYQMNNLQEDFDSNFYKTTWLPSNSQTTPLIISYVNHFGEQELYYDYLLELFDETDILNIHDRIMLIIKQVLKNNSILIQDINILSDTDINLLKEFNNTGDYTLSEDTIISRFEKIVNKNKSKIALKYNDTEMTYSELNKKANSVANYIIKKKIKKGSGISIIFDKNIELFIAMLGIMKAGCYYIPILPEEEQSRAEFIIQNSDSVLLITEPKYSTQISTDIIKNQVLIEDLLGEDTSNPNIKTKPSDISYLIYTSGSTGVPKGVMIKHENVVSFIDSLNQDEEMKSLPTDIHFTLLKCSFDAFAYDVYSAFLNGTKLIVLPKKVELDPEAVVKLIEKEKITKFVAVSTWAYRISHAAEIYKADLSSIRYICMGGEVAKPQNLKYMYENFPNIIIHNIYGPTETTIYTTAKKIDSKAIESNYTTIGKPIPYSRMLVMNKNSCEILPIDTYGELVVYEDDSSIKNISDGYLKLEDKMKERYIKFVNPFTNKLVKGYRTGDIVKINKDLEIDYLGRKDDFKKIHGGYLVSMAEVEKRIEKFLGSVLNIAVVSAPIRNENSIVLFVSKKTNGTNITISDINEEINQHLTFYMKPKQIIELDELPMSTNGKINKLLLASKVNDYLKEKNNYIQPTNTTEQKIYNTIKEIINFDFSITDDFENDLGIDSLNMTILYSKLNNPKISIQDLYTYPTVKDLAYIMQKEDLDDNKPTNENTNILNASNKTDLEKVLLTGATGFVGVHILKELAFNENIKKIYCIVRQKLNLTSEDRFKQIIHNYFDEDTCKIITKKTSILNGDLRKSNLGLDEHIYNRVFKDVKTIINTAANVKHIGKYSTFNTDNVETVNNLIKICLDFNISLAHISTLSLNGYNNKNVKEIFTENTLNINQTFDKNPYLISKYEAEKIILKNIEENYLNAKIFRIGNIMPRISDGVFQINYSQNGFLMALNTLYHLQMTTNQLLNFKTYLTPVDDCCRAIMTILNDNYCNTIYHIESDKPVKFNSIINIFNNRNTDIKTVTNDVFEHNLSVQYSYGTEYIKTYLFANTNKYNKDITLAILDKLDFHWSDISKDYLENITNISLKIKQ